MDKRQITIRGISITYFESGSGRSVLFFHGGRLRSLIFKKILMELSKNNHVIAPDIPGYGDSSIPTSLWSFKDYAEFFLEFLEALKINDITLIGYSLGGGIAYHLAAINPKVKKLILIDSAGIEKTTDNQFKRDLQRFFYYITHPQHLFIFCSLIKEYILFSLKHIKSIKHMRNIRETCNDLSGYLENIRTPTSIIWAKKDAIFPIKIAYKLHDSIASSTLDIVDGNHDWVFYENDKFMNYINKNLKKAIKKP